MGTIENSTVEYKQKGYLYILNRECDIQNLNIKAWTGLFLKWKY